MKYLICFSLIFFFCLPTFAEVQFSDLPKNHWAAGSVYDLVRQGITSGYPDGTFRGEKPVSRFEMAVFLEKLGKTLKRNAAINEKYLAELESEFALIKYEKEKAAKETQFFGKYETIFRSAALGSKIGYRLKLSLTRNFYEDSSFKLNLDTIDAGLDASSNRELAAKMLDFEGKFKWNKVNYFVTVGSGKVIHTEADDIFPSENNIVYPRPNIAIGFDFSVGKLNFSTSYVGRKRELSGKTGVNELTAKANYHFPNVNLFIQPHYLFQIDGRRDMLVEIGGDISHSKHFETNLVFGVGNFQTGSSYLKLKETINDPLQSGTSIALRFDRVGSGYRDDLLDKYEFISLNNFDRLILDGTVDFGARLNQKILKNFALEWKGDFITTEDYNYGDNYPGTYFIWQLSMFYDFSSSMNGSLFYRAYHVPSGIAQFSDSVPTFSEMIGIGATVSF